LDSTKKLTNKGVCLQIIALKISNETQKTPVLGKGERLKSSTVVL